MKATKAPTKADLEAVYKKAQAEVNAAHKLVREAEAREHDLKTKLVDFTTVQKAIDAVVNLRADCMKKEYDALQLELPCGICSKWNADAVGRCNAHDKPVKGFEFTSQSAMEAALAEILQKCDDICERIEQASENEDGFDAERDALLDALGVTEHEWSYDRRNVY